MLIVFNLFKKTLKFPVLWVSLVYLFWWMFTFTNDFYSKGIAILIAYFIITVLETWSLLSTNKILTVVLFVILLLITLLSRALAIVDNGQWLSESIWLHRHLIYLPLIILFSGYKAYNLFQKPLSENGTFPILLFIATFPILAINVAYPVSYFPEVLDRKEARNLKYYIIWERDFEYHSYFSFYKCEKWSFKCNDLYTDYQKLNFDKILIDKEKNEVSAIRKFGLGLAFTDGANPRQYDGDSVQLGDHVYQLAVDAREFQKCMAAPSCNSYIDILYECNLDYTSCDPLPVQYHAINYDYGWDYLEINEATNEINAYDRDDQLIFTYGANPSCYVDKCVILDK